MGEQTNLRDDGHLLTQVVEADLQGENVVDVDLPLRFGQAEQSRDEGAFASAGSANDADLADRRREETTTRLVTSFCPRDRLCWTHLLARPEGGVDVSEDRRAAAAVGEVHVPKGQLTSAGPVGGHGVLFRRPLGFALQLGVVHHPLH